MNRAKGGGEEKNFFPGKKVKKRKGGEDKVIKEPRFTLDGAFRSLLISRWYVSYFYRIIERDHK